METVFAHTHFMDEAQYLANRVAVISHGEIVAEGPPDTLAGRDTMRARIRFRRVEATARRRPICGQVDGWTTARSRSGPTIRRKPVHELTGWALDGGIDLEVLEVTPPEPGRRLHRAHRRRGRS